MLSVLLVFVYIPSASTVLLLFCSLRAAITNVCGFLSAQGPLCCLQHRFMFRSIVVCFQSSAVDLFRHPRKGQQKTSQFPSDLDEHYVGPVICIICAYINIIPQWHFGSVHVQVHSVVRNYIGSSTRTTRSLGVLDHQVAEQIKIEPNRNNDEFVVAVSAETQ